MRALRKIFGACLLVLAGVALGRMFDGVPATAAGGGGGAGGGIEKCAAKNGDVNADGKVDRSDAVTILGNLFLGSPTELVPLCAPPAAPAGLPDTAQKACYSFDPNRGWLEVPCDQAACAGQDGAYATGCPPEGRFSDNGDGTVTDHCTGLMWQKDTADASGDGSIDDGDRTYWCDALAYCENLSFAGHDDWRLPNVRELQSIVDYGRWGPAIDPVFGAVSFWYWSSTSPALFPGVAWGVAFESGPVYVPAFDLDEDNRCYVRAVRSGT